MRVLFINENIGGHATVHHHLRQTVAAYPDIEATFVDVPKPGPLRRFFSAPIPFLARFDLDLQPLRSQLALSAWVRRRLPALAKDADVVHVYTQNAALLSSRWLRRLPSVVTLDSTNAENAFRLPYRRPAWATSHTWKISRLFERRVFAAADVIVANSEWVSRSLNRNYGVTPPRVQMIPFGIVGPEGALALDIVIQGEEAGAVIEGEEGGAPGPPAPDGRPRIVFVGRQFGRKGGFDLLAAFGRQLADRAELILVTQEPVPPTEHVTVVSDLEPGDGRLWELLRSSHIFAFPSPIDQSPNAVLEAMAAGLPVVAVDTAALPEMVDHERTGLLVPPGDQAALGGALARLVDNPEERAEMGRRGRTRFEAIYDANIATAQLVKVLTDVASRERTAA